MLVSDASDIELSIFLVMQLTINFFMAQKNMSKMDLICCSFVGLCEWMAMSFVLKNVDDTIKEI